VTSRCTKRARSSPSSVPIWAPSSSRTSPMTTRPPSPTTARAMAAPIPRAPPLTSTVLSSSLPMVSPFLSWSPGTRRATWPDRRLLLLFSFEPGGRTPGPQGPTVPFALSVRRRPHLRFAVAGPCPVTQGSPERRPAWPSPPVPQLGPGTATTRARSTPPAGPATTGPQLPGVGRGHHPIQ
jgi:hypothetical protein